MGGGCCGLNVGGPQIRLLSSSSLAGWYQEGHLREWDECPNKGIPSETFHPFWHGSLGEPMTKQLPQAATHLLALGPLISQECTEL